MKLATAQEVLVRLYESYTVEEIANNDDDFLVHAQEEAMDLALYLEKLIQQRNG